MLAGRATELLILNLEKFWVVPEYVHRVKNIPNAVGEGHADLNSTSLLQEMRMRKVQTTG